VLQGFGPGRALKPAAMAAEGGTKDFSWGHMDAVLGDLTAAVARLDGQARVEATTKLQGWTRGHLLRKAFRESRSHPPGPASEQAPAPRPSAVSRVRSHFGFANEADRRAVHRFVEEPKKPEKPEKPEKVEPAEKVEAPPVPSIFRSMNEADAALLHKVYTPDIFAFRSGGAGGVKNDTSSFELRAAARLNARKMALDSREDDALWRQLRWERRQADAFSQAFHFRECQGHQPDSFHYPRSWYAGRPRPQEMAMNPELAARRQPSKADYLDELWQASPGGFAHAVQMLNS